MAGLDFLLELKQYLSTSLGLTFGENLFMNAEVSDTTGAALFVMELRSPPPALTQGETYIRRPRLRFAARSTAPSKLQSDYPDITTARNLSQRAYQACLDVAGKQLPSTGVSSPGNWLFAIPETEPFLFDRDDFNRVVFAFDVGCERQESPG